MHEERERFPSSMGDMAERTAQGLANLAAHKAFELFRNPKFRRQVRLDHHEQVEQDRIFNELLVSHQLLIMLLMEAPDLRVPPDVRSHLLTVKNKIPDVHIRQLADLGLPKIHCDEWRTLMDMRYAEYTADRHQVRAATMALEAQDGGLEKKSLDRLQIILPAQTVALGCHRHVCRGELEGTENLLRLIANALGRFLMETRIHLEGGRVSLTGRAKMAVRRAVRKILG